MHGPESEIDSLWWERIAQGALNESPDKPEVTISLFRRSLDKDDPSWLCHFNLTECHCQTDNIREAIDEAELALKSAESEGCRLTPKEDDLMMVRFRLGQFYLENENIQQAAEQFLMVSKSSEVGWAKEGWVAHMKANLKANDAEAARNMLRGAFVTEDSEISKVQVLRIISKDPGHNYTISKMFTAAKGDDELLKAIVAAIEKSTDPLESGPDQATDMPREIRFAMQEAHGVLLYHQGMTVAYRTSSEDAKSVAKALTFWEACRDELRIIGGSVASTTRAYATSQLAKYYFETLIRDQGLTEHFDALSKLADEDSSVEGEDPAGFLAVLYALRDDQPQNDYLGHRALFKCLAFYQDFNNSAAALNLMGAPDLVTNALEFDNYDILEEDESEKARIMELLKVTGRKVSQAARMNVSDSSHQIQRIEVAKEQIEGSVDTDSTTSKVNTILTARISVLQETQDSVMQDAIERYGWYCNGLGPPGTTCDKVAEFDHEFFHCIYCASCYFCTDCFKKLREQSTPALQCSAEHVWIKMPRQGSDFYRGFEAKSLRVPVVRPVEGDRSVLEACYDGDHEMHELKLEAWKAGLA